MIRTSRVRAICPLVLAVALGVVAVPRTATSAAEAAGDVGAHLVTGRILDADGRPVARMRIGRPYQGEPVLSADDGRFGVTLDESGEVQLRSPDDTRPENLSITAVVRGLDGMADRDVGDLVLPAQTDARLRIVLPDGSAPSRAHVIASSSSTDPSAVGPALSVSHVLLQTRGDVGAQGSLTLGALAGADFPQLLIDAYAANGNAWNFHVPSGSQPVDGVVTVQVPADPSISGRVLDSAGDPATWASVQLFGSQSRSTTDAEGRFRFPFPLERGTLIVQAGQSDQTGRYVLNGPDITAGGDVDLGDLRLPRLPTHEIEVVDGNGQPVPQATVVGAPGELDQRWVGSGHDFAEGYPVMRADYYSSARTDDAGRVSGRFPVTSDESLIGLFVRYRLRRTGELFVTEIEDAVLQADGVYRIVLEGLELPPPLPAPTRVRATPADGSVVVEWTAPPPRQPDDYVQYVVTSWPSGTETIAPGTRAVIPSPNGQPVTFTVAAEDLVRRGATSARTPSVTPQAFTTTLVRDPRVHGVVVSRRPSFGIRTSVPASFLACNVDGASFYENGCAGTTSARPPLLQPGEHELVITPWDADWRAAAPLRLRFVSPRGVRSMVDRRWDVTGGRAFGPHAYSETTHRRATLTSRVQATRGVSLVARTGRRQGTLEVTLDGRVLRRVRLGALPAQERRVITVASLARARAGELRIRVVSSRKPVRVYGVATTA